MTKMTNKEAIKHIRRTKCSGDTDCSECCYDPNWCVYAVAIEALHESEWNVITSDEEGTLYCLPDEEENVILSYNNSVWIDVLTSDIHGVFFDNYGGIEEGMAWKYAIPYKGE